MNSDAQEGYVVSDSVLEGYVVSDSALEGYVVSDSLVAPVVLLLFDIMC
jgi:hypothetical protein